MDGDAERVAATFNPTIGPLELAIVALRSDGDGYADVGSAWLAAIAPDAHLSATTWVGFPRT